MHNYVSDRLNLIEPSPTLAVTAKANQLKAEGKDVVGFGAGEPDFDTPAHIKEAVKKALDEGFTKYTPVSGIAPLKEAIVEKFKRENGLTFTPKQVIVSTGGKQSLYNLFMATLNEGDEVIVPAPYWVSYKDMVALAGGVTKVVHTKFADSFKLRPADLERAITPRTKIFIMNSPSNPTGATYTYEEMIGLADVIKRHKHILVVTDDIYEKLLYDGQKFYNIPMVMPELLDRSVVINGLSKAYSMTGWRLGYTASVRTEIIEAMDAIQGQSTSNANSFAQKGAVAALNGDQQCVEDMKKSFVRRRDMVFDALSKIPGLRVQKPEGAFYIFPDIHGLKKLPGFEKLQSEFPQETSLGKLIARALLEKHLVAVVPGEAFGYPHGFRISYAVSEEQIQKGCERIADFVKSIS